MLSWQSPFIAPALAPLTYLHTNQIASGERSTQGLSFWDINDWAFSTLMDWDRGVAAVQHVSISNVIRADHPCPLHLPLCRSVKAGPRCYHGSFFTCVNPNTLPVDASIHQLWWDALKSFWIYRIISQSVGGKSGRQISCFCLSHSRGSNRIRYR